VSLITYKVLDIYRDLPKTNCGECGKGSCFAFASAVYLEAFPLDECRPLDSILRGAMQDRLDRGRNEGEGRRPVSSEQALRALLSSIETADLTVLAENSLGLFIASPEEGVDLVFLDGSYRVTRTGVTSLRGDVPSVSVKILLLIYLTRASGRPEAGVWISYRDLPNTVSKSKSFEEAVARVAKTFSGDSDRLERTLRSLGGRPADSSSADKTFHIQVLPRVSVLLLFWDEEEEFPARVSLLLDREVLDYLDQEAIVFMAEALAARLLGEDLDDIVA
jgi:hypothetical protein